MSAIPKPGDVFQDRYELIERIGLGSFAVVYRGKQVGIGREVAVKILLPNDEEAFARTATERFKREARLLSTLRHPNTLTMFDFGHAESGLPFIVTEFVPGTTLKQLIKQVGCLSPSRAYQIIRQVLLSLQEAHACGIIHRDMKPGNIMIFDRADERDVVKVLDFGIAKFIENMHGDEELQELTLKGEIIGTPRYMAPELLTNKGVFPATDIYAVGLIFYEMITGVRAVNAKSPAMAMAEQVIMRPAIHPEDPLVPGPLRGLLARATAKPLDERIGLAQQLLDELEGVDWAAVEGWQRPSEEARNRIKHGLSSSGEQASAARSESLDLLPHDEPNIAVDFDIDVADSGEVWGEMDWRDGVTGDGLEEILVPSVGGSAPAGEAELNTDSGSTAPLHPVRTDKEAEDLARAELARAMESYQNSTSPTVRAVAKDGVIDELADTLDAEGFQSQSQSAETVKMSSPDVESLTTDLVAAADRTVQTPVVRQDDAGSRAPAWLWYIAVFVVTLGLGGAALVVIGPTLGLDLRAGSSDTTEEVVDPDAVVIRTEPSGATVRHGERLLGTTPLKVQIKAQRPIVLDVVAEGFKREKINLDSSTRGNLRLELEPLKQDDAPE